LLDDVDVVAIAQALVDGMGTDQALAAAHARAEHHIRAKAEGADLWRRVADIIASGGVHETSNGRGQGGLS
jgi:hypothetical protein